MEFNVDCSALYYGMAGLAVGTFLFATLGVTAVYSFRDHRRRQGYSTLPNANVNFAPMQQQHFEPTAPEQDAIALEAIEDRPAATSTPIPPPRTRRNERLLLNASPPSYGSCVHRSQEEEIPARNMAETFFQRM
jgi:hypothetical protein